MQRIRPWLWIGSFRGTRDLAQLQANGIGAMLQLAAEEPHATITTLHLAVEDGEPLDGPTLRRGLEFVARSRALSRVVLIACGAGISRSAAFCVAALKEAEGSSLPAAFAVVRSAHPVAAPHPALWRSLGQYFGEPVSERFILDVMFKPHAE